jgi:formate transporter
MPSKTPRDIVCAVDALGCAKAELDAGRLMLLGFLAGAYIAFGGLLAVIVGGGVAGIGSENPGLQRFIFAAVFPVGLMLVVIAGAELFTGNAATCIPAALSRRVAWRAVLRNWTLSYAGNLAGSLVVAYFLTYLTGLLSHGPWLASIVSIAESKVSQDFGILLLKGIGCNWLVCLGVWLAVSADDVAGKVLGIWFPIMAFVAIGFEHSVANMYFIPAGIFYGASVTWGQFFLNNLVPVTIGNVIGGTVFVGVVYWYLYGDRSAGGPRPSQRR